MGVFVSRLVGPAICNASRLSISRPFSGSGDGRKEQFEKFNADGSSVDAGPRSLTSDVKGVTQKGSTHSLVRFYVGFLRRTLIK